MLKFAYTYWQYDASVDAILSATFVSVSVNNMMIEVLICINTSSLVYSLVLKASII